MKTAEEIKNEVAGNNNFDSFERAIRYTFNRELLQSEKEFINKLINETMEEYASLKLAEASNVTDEDIEKWANSKESIQDFMPETLKLHIQKKIECRIEGAKAHRDNLIKKGE